MIIMSEAHLDGIETKITDASGIASASGLGCPGTEEPSGKHPPRHFWIFNPYVTISQGVNFLNFGCHFGCSSGVTVLYLSLIARGYSLS